MKKVFSFALGALTLITMAHAARPWDRTYAAFNGKYLLYSGGLGDAAAPTPTDRKAALALHGDVAKNLFDSIGPDLKGICGTTSRLRIRQKGDLDCVHDKDDRASPYVCHIGIDLQSGKSMHGSIC